MDIKRALVSIGKSTFIKYYYSFKNKSRNYCIDGFEEDYTDKAKASRTSHAQRIFREGKQKEALEMIINSRKIDESIKSKAREILDSEL